MAKVDLTGMKNIIFDLGGVILDVDYNLTKKAFEELGVKQFDRIYSQLKQNPLFDNFETGEMSSANFRKAIKDKLQLDLSDVQIDSAWNAMLLKLPESRLALLEKLSEKYRLFLLSNTNEIHIEAFTEIIQQQHNITSLEKYFEKIYFSNQIGLRKPDKIAFEYILKDNALNASETFFIDDSPQHIEGAKDAGLRAYYLQKNEDIADIF